MKNRVIKIIVCCLFCFLCCCGLIFSVHGFGNSKPSKDTTPVVIEDVAETVTIIPSETVHRHDYEPVLVLPTCNSNGYTEYICQCGSTYIIDETEKLMHQYVTNVVPASCSQQGYHNHTCSLCGDSYQDNYTDKLGHLYTVKTVLATSNSRGYDLHTCSTCGDTYKDNYTHIVITCIDVNETVYANATVNIRTGPSTDYDKIGSLSYGDSIQRIGICDNNWSKCIYNEREVYIFSDYLTTSKPPVINSSGYPLTYSDSTATITIYKEWYHDAYVYAAHLQFSDYKRFGTDCANGKYDNGYETTSHAANRLGAIFAVNGCYSAPYLGYGVARHGVLCNEMRAYAPAVYSFNDGILCDPWDNGTAKEMLSTVIADGRVTDTFWFGPKIVSGGQVVNASNDNRAQRTFIGTNGNAGDIWVCVSDGRYNDGVSAGLTHVQCAEFLISKGCTFGVPLDGGGSSTMFFNGRVLNAANGNQRAVVDFVYFK